LMAVMTVICTLDMARSVDVTFRSFDLEPGHA